MNISAPAPTAEKLALAFVDLPHRAVSMPVGEREDQTRYILQTAAESGVDLIATRPEGDNERILGQAWPFPSPFGVTVRTVSIAEGVDRVEARVRRSLERLGLPRGDTILVSNANDLAGAEGRALWDRLNALKSRGLFKRIGICLTMEDGPALMARRFQPDVVQIPCNILDQRPVMHGVFDELASLSIGIHLASVFAGGLLFTSPENLPGELIAHGQALSRSRRQLAEARVDPMQAALAFALGLPSVEAVVASVASVAELRAVLAAAHAPRPDLNWGALALNDHAASLSTAQLRLTQAA